MWILPLYLHVNKKSDDDDDVGECIKKLVGECDIKLVGECVTVIVQIFAVYLSWRIYSRLFSTNLNTFKINTSGPSYTNLNLLC